jgi:hypothetical protein
MAWEALQSTYERFERVLRFFSVYSKLGAAKHAIEEGTFWIDEVEDDVDQISFDALEEGLVDSDVPDELSEEDSLDSANQYSSILEFDDLGEGSISDMGAQTEDSDEFDL